jgi:hypothetical protein
LNVRLVVALDACQHPSAMYDVFHDDLLTDEDVLAPPAASGGPDPFWPLVLRVAAVGARGAAPLFRAVGRRLAPEAARTAARRMPGVFVRGTARQVRQFARRVGGQLVGPERHGTGLPHFHLIRNGQRTHVWYGRRVPRGTFFE